MKLKYDKKTGTTNREPETFLESVETLEELFKADMWHSKIVEWKTEEDMHKYLDQHFQICKNEIEKLMKENK